MGIWPYADQSGVSGVLNTSENLNVDWITNASLVTNNSNIQSIGSAPVDDHATQLQLATLSANANSSTGGLTLISDQTLAVASLTVTFANIPGTFRNLRLEIQARDASATGVDTINVQFNGDAGNNYSFQYVLASNPAAAIAAFGGSVAAMELGILSGANSAYAFATGVTVIDIPNYVGTTFAKNVVSKSSMVDSTQPASLTGTFGGLWFNTNAITSITILNGQNANFVIGSRFMLYGL